MDAGVRHARQLFHLRHHRPHGDVSPAVGLRHLGGIVAAEAHRQPHGVDAQALPRPAQASLQGFPQGGQRAANVGERQAQRQLFVGGLLLAALLFRLGRRLLFGLFLFFFLRLGHQLQPDGTCCGRDAQLVAEADAHTYPQQQQQDDQQQKYAQYPQCDQQGPPFLLFSLRRQVPLVVQAHLAVGLQPRHLRQILQ